MADDPTARTLKLLGLLQAHRFWKGSELAERLAVSERTVRRDVDRLRDLGYAVDATPGLDGGYRLVAGRDLPPLLVDDDEAIALAVGLQTAAVAAIEGMEETTTRVMAKLEQVLPGRLRHRVDAIRHSVEVLKWSPGASTVSPAVLTVMTQGCRAAEEVRFDYVRRDGEAANRLVEPHQLVSAGRRWYLVAWDLRRADWRTFRLDRMANASLAGRRFTPRPLPASDAATYVAESLERNGPTTATATVVVTSPTEGPDDAVDGLARWLRAEVEPLGGGRFRLRLAAEHDGRLLTEVAILASHLDLTLEDGSDRLRAGVSDLAQRLQRLG